MKRVGYSLICSFISTVMLACGGSEPPAKSAEDVTTAEPAASAATDSPAAAPDESWEGESEATAAPADDSAGSGDVETRTTDVIAQIVRNNRKPFRDCYEKGKSETPELRGTLTLHFVLDPEGKVKLAELNAERSTITSKVVVDCAIGVLKGLSFPPSSRGMESTVNYPFDFKP